MSLNSTFEVYYYHYTYGFGRCFYTNWCVSHSSNQTHDLGDGSAMLITTLYLYHYCMSLIYVCSTRRGVWLQHIGRCSISQHQRWQLWGHGDPHSAPHHRGPVCCHSQVNSQILCWYPFSSLIYFLSTPSFPLPINRIHNFKAGCPIQSQIHSSKIECGRKAACKE